MRRLFRTGRAPWWAPLSLLAGLVLGLLPAGPLQPEASAAACASPGGSASSRSPLALVGGSIPALGLADTEVRWVRWHTRVLYGEPAMLEGQVVTSDGAVPDARVDLLAKEAGSAEWTRVGSATSDPDTGVFAFDCLRPVASTDYRAVFHGTLWYGPSQGDRRIAVARRVPDTMRLVAPARFRFHGAVEPRYAGRPVLLQRQSCPRCRWDTVGRTLSSDRSGWRFGIDVSSFTGDRWFRAVVPADGSYARSFSAHTWRLSHR